MSVTGECYIDSAKTTVGIVSSYLGIQPSPITRVLLSYGEWIITCTMVVISCYWMDQEGAQSDQLWTIVFFTMVAAIMVSNLIFSVLIQAINAVFVFFCFDVKFREMGYFSNNMPNEIVQALGNYGRS